MNKRIIPVIVIGAALAVYGVSKWRSSRETGVKGLYYGTAEATEILISSQVSGAVEELAVSEGEHIGAGDRIAVIDDTLLKARTDQMEKNLAVAETRMKVIEAQKNELNIKKERLQKLSSSGAAPEADYEDLVSAFEVLKSNELVAGKQIEQARSGLELAEKQLAYSVISSPSAGRVLKVHHEKGETVFPGAPIITIADLSQIEINVYIPEPKLGMIKPGQSVKVFTDSFPDKPLSGTVSVIADRAEFTPKNVQTRKERVRLVYEVTVRVDNPDEILKIGMPVDVRFDEQ